MGKLPDTIDRMTRLRLRLSAFRSLLSIALTFFFIGALTFIVFFAARYMQNLSKKVEVEVLFYEDVKDVDIIAIEQQLKLESYIASSRVSSRADNIQEAIRIVGNDYTEIFPSPVTATIIFSVTPSAANGESLSLIAQEIEKNPMVRDVEYSDTMVETVLNNFRKLQWIILSISAVFILITMMQIANFIRLNVYAKRFNIRSMLLVGATHSFVRKPFLWKGLVQGIWGGALSTVLLGLMLYQGNYLLPEFVDFTLIAEIAFLFGVLYVFCILFCLFTTLFSVNKYIKMNTDQLYL